MADLGYSETTLASLPRDTERDLDRPYPDRSATPNGVDPTTGENTYPLKDSGSSERLTDVPRTTEDMSKLFTAKRGDQIFGDHAKRTRAMNEQRKDENRGEAEANTYPHKRIYINTLSSEGIEKQYRKIKPKRSRRFGRKRHV